MATTMTTVPFLGGGDDKSQLSADYVMYADIDGSQELESEDVDQGAEFFTTQAGDTPVNVMQDPQREAVLGFVMYNQAAVCTSRHGKRITGTQTQRNFIQKLVSTLPDHACPLMTLDGCLGFGRIFWSNATDDKYSVLGAIPTWVYGTKKHTHGFTTLLNMI